MGAKEKSILKNASKSPVLGKLPFLLFLAFLGVIYIANANYSHKKLREIQHTQKEIKSLRWESMGLKSQLSAKTKRSQVVKSMADVNLQLPKQQLKKILIRRKQ